MTEFEKMIVETYPYLRPTSADTEFARQIWLAALRWVLNRKHKHLGYIQDIEDELNG